MDNVLKNLPAILTLVGLYITSVYGPKVLAKIQGKAKKEEIRLEGDAQIETVYVQNIGVIMNEYKEQVSGFKSELTTVRNELSDVRKEFGEFKEQHNEEVAGYKSQIVFLENRIAEDEEKINELKADVLAKERLIAELEGDK